MEKDKVKRACLPGVPATQLLALFLVVCLAECATGSCLSYGHSCWGAHGKRSGNPPEMAPDWYITRILRQMAANGELKRTTDIAENKKGLSAIFEGDVASDSRSDDQKLGFNNEEEPTVFSSKRNPEGIPMLDDQLLTKLKFWKIMRKSSEDE